MIYKIRNAAVILLLIIVAYLLQCSILSSMISLRCAPNLLLIISFVSGYSGGKVHGLFTGLTAGLVMDIFFCDVIGFNALIFMCIGYASGIWNKYFYSDNLYVPLALLIGSELLYVIIYYVVWFALRARFDIGYYLGHFILPEFLLTVVAGILLYFPLAKLHSRLYGTAKQL